MTESTQTLAQLAKAQDYDALEELWLERCELPLDDPTSFLDAAQALKDKGELKRVSVLLSLLLPNCSDGTDPGVRLALLELAAECDPDDLGVRRQLLEALAEAYPDCGGLKAFVRAADVENSPQPAEAMALMRDMMRFDVGRHVYHPAGWGAGTISRVSAATGKMTVDFEHNEGHSMPLTGARSLLEVLDEDDFRAMCFARLDEVKRLAAEDPAALFESLLKARRGKATTKQVKLDLLDRVVPKGEWSKWWPGVKRALRHAPMIEMTAGNSPDFILRDKPITAQEELLQRFRAAARYDQKFAAARECLSHPQAFKDAGELLDEIASGLLSSATQWQADAPSRWLEALLVVEALRQHTGQADMPDGMRPRQVIADSHDVVELLRGMTEDDLRREALALVRDIWPDDWPEVWAWMLTTPSPSLCDYVIRELDESAQPESVQAAIAHVMEKPERNPDATTWLWRRTMADKLPIHFDAAGKTGVFEKMLRLLNSLVEAGDKPMLSKVRNSLSASNFDPIEELARAAPGLEARRLHDIVRFNKGLTERAKQTILTIFEAAHPGQFAVALKPWEETFTYSTAAGIDKQQQELVRLTTVEYVKITKAIGEAAAQGDISDNAEYQAAIEARGQLTQRAAAIKEQIDNVKIITRAMAPDNEVGIGTKVQLKDLDDGSQRTLCLLGPWDADPETDVLSYRAPFSHAFLGKALGDVVEVQSGDNVHRYEIVGLGSAL